MRLRSLSLWLGLAAVAAAWSSLPAQQHAFKQLAPRDGLAQSQVRCMGQDAQGYLWFGTLGGASRYDGHSFENFALQDGLPDAHVSAMVRDAHGTLWMASGNALVVANGRRLESTALPTGTGGARIMALAADANGALYAGTDGDGLFVQRNGSLQPLPGYPQDTATHVRALLALRDGRLLVGLRNGLLVCDGVSCTTVTLDAGDPLPISALAEAPDGSWWVGTFLDGLYQVGRNGTVRNYDERSGLLRDNVRSLLVDDRGRLWVGSKFGLTLLDKGRMRVFTIHQGMPNDNVWCSFQDQEGNLWFGTDGAGALRYAGDRFLTFTVRDGLCSDLVMAVVPDAQGDLWLGTYDNGVCRMDGMAMVNTLDGLPNNTVWCGLSDRNGALWFGTNDGLAKLERGIVVPLAPDLQLAGERVMALHEDEQGRIWVGSREGLYMLEGGVLRASYPAGKDGPGRSVRSIVGGGKGAIWMATEQGVYRFDGRSFQAFTTQEGLSDNNVLCLRMDDQGRLWAGTANGLSCHAQGRWTDHRLGPDFGSNYVDLLLTDAQGRLWAGTTNGIIVIQPDSLLAGRGSMEHIGLNEGLRSLEFNLNAGVRDARGRLFLGSTGGLVYHDASRHAMRTTVPVPRVHIVGLRSFLQATDWQGQCDSLNAEGLPQGLLLAYRRNYLTFDYTAVSLTAPERVRYRYRLLGVDQDWLPATDARFASYSSLPQGHYTFEVMAAVGDGPWSEPATFSFRIAPPFWLRWWFFALCAVAIALVAYGVARFRAVRRARREHTRQLMLRSRMLQLEQQALNANMNRHFVFNALNSIQYHINRQDRATASRYLTSFAKLIRRNLDASQSDTTTLAEELERLELYLTLEHMRFKDRFRYQIAVLPGVDATAVQLPAMMLQPYVENSIWHGILPIERQGTVGITVEQGAPGRVVVRIEDDGVGVEHSMRNKESDKADHISRGIEITKGRADVLRRSGITDIRITGPEQRSDGPGTWVCIDLPAGEDMKKPQKDLGSASDHLIFGRP